MQVTYDANGQRTSVSVTPPAGSGASVVKDFYQLGHLAYQTDGAGTLLASLTCDSTGAPVSVHVGNDPSSASRSYYVYNAHGDVVDLTDTQGNLVATYSYDSQGALTSSNETFTSGANGWSNPYRYDGRDGARYDASTGLYWLSVRAYDPTLGRFLSRDPLGRAPLFVADNPYVYARGQRLAWWLGGYSLIWPQSIPAPDIFLPMSTEELVARIRVRFQPELVQHGIRILDIGERRPPMPRMPRRR